MATVTIAHALFTWRENGEHRIAFHGNEVQIPDEVVDEYTRFGVFAPDPEPQPGPEPIGVPEPVETVDLDARPADSALKEVWVEYAVRKGYGRDEAEAATKPELMKALG